MINALKIMDLLDKHGFYKISDAFQRQFVKIADWPYNLTSLDELPLSARQTTWDKNKEDYNQFDDLFWKELKQRLPDYRGLNTDKSDVDNMEGELHGPDSVPGPAYVYPGENPISPSMMGGLDDFTWENTHDVNKGPDEWKNLQPRH